jgi:hypothetical protein
MAVADVAGASDVDLEARLVAETPRLLRLAYSVLGDAQAAEDAVQDTLVLAWEHWHALRDPGKVGSWLTRICVRRAIRCRRSLLRRLLHETPDGVSSDVPSPLDGPGDGYVDWDSTFRSLSPRSGPWSSSTTSTATPSTTVPRWSAAGWARRGRTSPVPWPSFAWRSCDERVGP